MKTSRRKGGGQSGSENPAADKDTPRIEIDGQDTRLDQREQDAVAEVERVVRGAGEHVGDTPEAAPALLDDLEPDELEDVVLALLGRRQRLAREPRAASRARPPG